MLAAAVQKPILYTGIVGLLHNSLSNQYFSNWQENKLIHETQIEQSITSLIYYRKVQQAPVIFRHVSMPIAEVRSMIF